MSVKSPASTLAPAPQPPSPDAASLHISNARRATLLAVFCVAQLLDVVSVSGFFIALAQASIDLKLQLTQSVWIVTAYCLLPSLSLKLARPLLTVAVRTRPWQLSPLRPSSC